MAPPLTFGVEFEFALAYLPYDSIALPDPDDANKILHFTLTDEDWAQNEFDISREKFLPIATKFAARRSVRNTINEAGFPVSDEKPVHLKANVSKWEVVNDGSVRAPEGSPYEWVDMEVRSPAFYFTSGSLKAVADVCILLNKTYGLHINDSMGLHVHVGDSNKGFDMITLSNLIAFLWAFEPQLNSLHPSHRQDQEWGGSMRESSLYARTYQGKYGRRPNPLTGAIHFLNCKSIMELIAQASSNCEPGGDVYKFSAYNFQGFYNRERGVANFKPTIEFRQHQATMSPNAVVNWIETVVGIVDYIRNIDYASLTGLLQMVEHEHWEKLGDGKDIEREARLGPILAESKFTIIDLLLGMGLHGPAKYYRTRWRKLAKKPPFPISPKPDIEWEFKSTVDPESDEYKRLSRLQENWEAGRIASEAQPPGGWKFDPDHPSWPAHHFIELQSNHPSDHSGAGSNPNMECCLGAEDEAGKSEAGDHVLAWILDQYSVSPPVHTSAPVRQLSAILEETGKELDAENARLDFGNTFSAFRAQDGRGIKNEEADYPRTFRTLTLSSEEAKEDLDAEEAEIDRQLAAFEPQAGASIGQEDKLWRERVRDGFGGEVGVYDGDGEIPKGSVNPFDDTLPRIRGWAAASPEVSPKTNPPVEDYGSDGKMPFP